MHREAVRVQRVTYPALWGAAVFVVTGCYAYVPAGERTAGEGEEVRVHLTPSGASDLAREIGPRMASVDGRIIQSSSDSGLTLSVSQLRSVRGEPSAWQGDAPLVIPRSAIAALEHRRLARRRTVVASTAATVALAAIGVLAVRGADRGGGTGGGPPPPPP
jgi:hypothetical protein